MISPELDSLSEPLDVQQRALMHAALEDSHFSCASMPNIQMPWEMPALSMVFGGEEDPIVPPVRPILGYVEPARSESEIERLPMSLQSKSTAFEHAISFESKRVCHLPEGDQLLLLLQKWEAVISISFQSFDLGIDIAVMDYEQRIATIGEVLGGKSVGTLRQRLGQIGQFVKWARSEAKRQPFPVTPELINYKELCQTSSKHGCTSLKIPWDPGGVQVC